jgi:Flp pilus assembly protein protease CpaA
MDSGVAAKKLLPYAGIPAIAAVYLILKPAAGDWATLALDVTLIAFVYAAAYLDLRTRKVPNKLVLAMLAAWLLIMSIYVVADIESAVECLVPSLIGGAAGGGFFLVMYLISGKGIGGGDIKLITVIGLCLTFAKLMPMLFISSLLTALYAGGLLLMKKATMKTAIPMVPFLYAGILAVLFL